MSLGYGIDFGTSNSTLVVARPDGTTVPVRDPGSPVRSATVPTSVCVLRDGGLAVGRAAENAKRLRPSSFRSEFKRDFGDPNPVRLDGSLWRPDELASEVLRFLRELAADQVPGPVGRVVITVPAAWEAERHKLMLSAAARAGFDASRVELVPEPIAAAAHALRDLQGTILVYDLGGGTFDCALAVGDTQATSRRPEGLGDPSSGTLVSNGGPGGLRDLSSGTLAAGGGPGYTVLGGPGGLGDLGGSEFDRLLLRLVRDSSGPGAAELFGGPADDADLLRRRLSLKDSCEAFKCRLSVADTHEDLFSELVPALRFELSRAEFEELLRPLLAETLAECDRLLRENGLSWTEVDSIVPVGGSSRIPLVTRLLSEHTGRPVIPSAEPELAIARGAARLATRTPGADGTARIPGTNSATRIPGTDGTARAPGTGSTTWGPGAGSVAGRRPSARSGLGLGLFAVAREEEGPRVKVSIRREHALNGSWGTMAVLVDGVERARLRDRQSAAFEVEPGIRRIECRQFGERSNVLTVEATEGELKLVCCFKELSRSANVKETITLALA